MLELKKKIQRDKKNFNKNIDDRRQMLMDFQKKL